MAKIKQNLGQIFENNFDCYTEYDGYAGGEPMPMAMTKEKFIEVVSNLLTEREANQANSENANCAIFDVSQQRELLIDFCEVYATGNFGGADAEDIVNWYLKVKDN